jgi:FKBP-type peptidyl-prolyl cis-trans isomerase
VTSKLRFVSSAVIFALVFAAASLPDHTRDAGGSPDASATGSSQEAGPPPVTGDTVTTDSGLKYVVIISGDGRRAERGRPVRLHYNAWLEDGTLFDSSYLAGEALEFTLGTGEVVPAWNEGVNLMRVGEKWRFIVPPDLGYGEEGYPGVIPPNATLIFDIVLLEVK